MKKLRRWLYPVILLILVSSAVGIYINQQAKLKSVQAPSCGYDVTTDDLGHYNIKAILPYERTVFDAVVNEMRINPPSYNVSAQDYDSTGNADPQEKAYIIVADNCDLDADTVRRIYVKVASGLAAVSKQGGLN